MVMKKYHLFAAAVAIASLAACSKSPVTPVETVEDGPVAVQFGIGSPLDVRVKSVGSVGGSDEQSNVWNGQELKIYGFERTVTDFTTTAFIDNVSATAPAGVQKGVLSVTNAAAANEPFYYASGINYDFYGYFTDDAETGEPVKTETEISVPFTIDGSQDLMIAKADQQTDIDAAKATDKVSADRAYSAYAARRGVQPTLSFKHLLSRFTFKIVAGSESANLISVNKISLKSKTTGSIVVVGENRGLRLPTESAETPAETPVELFLQQRGKESGVMEELVSVKTEAYTEARDNAVSVGESLMVIPGEEYELTIYMSRDNSQTTVDPYKTTISIAKIQGAPEGATAFEAGYSYEVTAVIYGLETVDITAALEPWKNGGSTTLDPDEE